MIKKPKDLNHDAPVLYYEYDTRTTPVADMVRVGNGEYDFTENNKARLTRYLKANNDHMFEMDLASKTGDQIGQLLDKQLCWFTRKGGDASGWMIEAKKRMPSSYAPDKRDFFLSWFEEKGAQLAKVKKTDVAISFVLTAPEIDSNECFNALRDDFIEHRTSAHDFDSLFTGKSNVKISWTGTVNELARFIFHLHKSKNGTPACTDTDNKYKFAVSRFLINGKKITADLKNNNRTLVDKAREEKLIRAVEHLKKTIPTTRK